ncbi:MAG: tetratricopeptide repeat protein, partial [Rhodospirillaceae bacterium]
MNAALQEDTDTPYHRAIKDYAAGRYAQALDKYQAIADENPRDRTALLGLAMSYEQLERFAEARQAYAQYLAVEPANRGVLSHVLRQVLSQPLEQSRDDLTMLVEAGVDGAEIMAALAEVSSALGNHEGALEYASSAVQKAPDVTAYYLNAGILADRLNRKAAAVAFYEQFLERYAEQSIAIDTPIDNIRDRLNY